LAFDPAGDSEVLLLGVLEVLQVLLQGVLVKLGKELRLDGRIEAPDIVDKLTFRHGVFTFGAVTTNDFPAGLRPALLKSENNPFELEREPSMAGVKSDTPVQSGSTPADQAVDHLQSLYKMSTTAGLGSQDYVAINNFAIAALVLGLLSFLVLFAGVLLIVPAAAVICAIVALRQIGNSSGTQTGKLLAVGGLVFGIGAVVFLFTQQAIHAAQRKGDEQKIAALVNDWGQKVVAGQLDAAYELMTPAFRHRISKTQFTDTLGLAQGHPQLGKLLAVTWNGRVLFDETTSDRMQKATGILSFEFEKAEEPGRQQVNFMGIDGDWKIDDLPTMFPIPQQN
jgi:hypothetical protein